MMILKTFFCIYKNVSQAVIGALAETNEERAQTLIIDLLATQEHKIPASELLGVRVLFLLLFADSGFDLIFSSHL
jgi:hypothetical protein